MNNRTDQPVNRRLAEERLTHLIMGAFLRVYNQSVWDFSRLACSFILAPRRSSIGPTLPTPRSRIRPGKRRNGNHNSSKCDAHQSHSRRAAAVCDSTASALIHSNMTAPPATTVDMKAF